MVMKLQMNLDEVIFDVETAFLHRDLKEKTCMDCPNGMVTFGNECLLLKQTILQTGAISGKVQSQAQHSVDGAGFRVVPVRSVLV